MIRLLFIFCFFFSAIYLKAQTWSIKDCIEYALKNNIDLKKNTIEQHIKKKDIEINKKERLPSVSASNSSTFSFGQQQDVFGNNRRNDNLNSSTSISSEFTLFSHRLIDKNIKKSTYETEASFYNGENLKQQLSIKIIEHYLSILVNKEIEKINYNNMIYAKEIFEKVEKSQKVGVSSKKELKESEAEFIKENFNYTKAKLETKRSIQQLTQTLQIEFSDKFEVIPINNEIDINLINNEEIFYKIIENNPSIEQSKVNINIEKINKEIIKTKQYPKLSLSAGVGTFYFNSFVNKSTSKSFFTQNVDNFTQQLAFNLTIPIYNKGIIKTQLEQSDLNRQYAEDSYKLQVITVEQEIQNIFLNMELFYETYLASKKLVESSKIAYEYGVISFEAGISTIYDLNILRNNLKQAESELIKAKYSYSFNQELLNVYLGK
ncbi:TolC family protein [Chishuiella sp.]|uniref:TolC family protein n=1 Tax=Chishuiella sp. TaxID=1969467 RepID=UPI0028B03672|nr:TolC family protein [Chishuiella sp.]